MTPRVYVACVACLNAGRIVGRWFDALTAPTEPNAFDLQAVDPTDRDNPHWQHGPFTLRVIDHTGFGRRLSSETTVEHARELAREIEEQGQ